MTPMLREYLGRYGGMAFVRETPLRFIPVRPATGTTTPHRTPPAPAVTG